MSYILLTVRILFFLLLTICFGSSESSALTNKSGHITSDETWSASGSPYVLNGHVIVDPGVTLTVTSGTIVLADDSHSLQLYVEGTLNADGAIFTSVRDPDYGIESGAPNNYDWYGIYFRHSGGGNCMLTPTKNQDHRGACGKDFGHRRQGGLASFDYGKIVTSNHLLLDM